MEVTPVGPTFHSDLAPVLKANDCGLGSLSRAILRRDPLGIGFDDYWGLDLLSRLLAWSPEARIDMSTAAKHAFFMGAYVSDLDGSEHATQADLSLHEFNLLKEEQLDYHYIVVPTEEEAVSRDVKHDMNEPLLMCAMQNDNASLRHCLDASIAAEVTDLEVKETRRFISADHQLHFRCPKCGREFTDWKSCNAHMTARLV